MSLAAGGIDRGFVTYAHRICLIGKQHGGLAYTLTLLPGEKASLYHSGRYRRTTFAQFVSALYQQQTSDDSSSLVQVLNNQPASASASDGGGINRGIFRIGAAAERAVRRVQAPRLTCPGPVYPRSPRLSLAIAREGIVRREPGL